MRADRPHNRSHLATSGRLLPSLPGDFGSALVSSPSVVASPDSVTLATILTTLQDLLRRSAGRLDTVEDRVASLETRLAGIKGLLPAHRRDSTSGMEPSAASTTVTAFETTTQPPVSTSAPAIFTLAITRTPPLHVLLPASSTAPSPPWSPKVAASPSSSYALLDRAVIASGAGDDEAHRHRRACRQPNLATPTPPPLLASPLTPVVKRTRMRRTGTAACSPPAVWFLRCPPGTAGRG
ncbi:unnamed protein product [Tilletia controversa]|uniref:Uncharacterized protein n=1 Tax=Tilletia controversa TaxID=13291 RepID=A0A8X7SSF3_9BASI|nr:hypothetical protein A4X06_0g9298 [Tilletia controversa]CAD6914191.1 unnamed protein product [Tilletia controversa]CAD6914937.1 unnamed protein product [Tilletia controversa]CAD6937417.1 unnamed protein product [Tilletia controversa]CAD6982484.1 unnamed protein product [Tilletia controversa]